jgi:hypothetical protein
MIARESGIATRHGLEERMSVGIETAAGETVEREAPKVYPVERSRERR